jgi:peptide/nickel transport system permease protein
VAWLAIVVAGALLAPWLPLERRQDLSNIRAAPSVTHPFGTDSRGVDMVVRVLDGARISLLVALSASIVGLALGAVIGLLGGYRRGRLDRSIVVGLDVFAAFPALLAASVASLIFGKHLFSLVIVLGVLLVPVFARVTRATTLPLAERDFVLASRMAGARHGRVMYRELVPNVAVPVLAYALLSVGIVIAIEGALSFLGAGVPERYTTWGKLIAAGQEHVDDAPHLSLVPAGIIVVTVLSLNTVSERWQRRWLFGSTVVCRRTPRRPSPSPSPSPPTPLPTTSSSPSAAQPGLVSPTAAVQVIDLHTWLDSPFGVVRAVDGVDLELQRGALTALVGESGSGKTMLARTIVGVVDAPRVAGLPGHVWFEGADLLVASESERRAVRGRRIAMVFQDPMTSLDPVLRIGRQLTEPMRVHLGISEREARLRAAVLLRTVGIPDPARRLSSYPHELSGGLRQRVAIAIALSCDPDVLIADEPTSALDVTVQAQILDLLDRLRRDRGLAVLLITHDLGIVAGRADTTAVMYGGRIVERGATTSVFSAPRHPYTAALLAAIPRVDMPSHQRLTVIGGSPPVLLGRPVGCAFAPRCAHAVERCRADDPSLENDDGHAVACWHPLRLAAPAASPR